MRATTRAWTLGLVLGTFASVSAQDAGVRGSIDAGNRAFMDAAAKGDAAALAALYTADGEAFPPNGEMAKGRQAIQGMWKSALDSGIAKVDLVTTEAQPAGANLAFEVGTYALQTKDGKTADRGKYVVVWKKENGRWMLHRDIWNSSMPPAAK